jgi:hypothetical protein
MTSIWRKLSVTTIVLALAVASAARGDTTTAFARVAEDEQQRPTALQMAIVTYVPKDGSRDFHVDLVSAIHIGDETYYTELNDRFAGYDALLYELVAPEGAVTLQPDGKRKGILSNTQLGMTKLLGLAFQLDEIDYDKANFVHADLSPEELRQSMAERDESLYVYFWRVFFASLDEYAKDPLGMKDWRVLSTMLESDQDSALKTMIAYEMTNIDQVRDIFGEDSNSAVIGARNQRVIEVLLSQLDSGAKRVGIFYGVAHMPDMEQRLLNEVGLAYYKTTWIDAWQLGSSSADAL